MESEYRGDVKERRTRGGAGLAPDVEVCPVSNREQSRWCTLLSQAEIRWCARGHGADGGWGKSTSVWIIRAGGGGACASLTGDGNTKKKKKYNRPYKGEREFNVLVWILNFRHRLETKAKDSRTAVTRCDSHTQSRGKMSDVNSQVQTRFPSTLVLKGWLPLGASVRLIVTS